MSPCTSSPTSVKVVEGSGEVELPQLFCEGRQKVAGGSDEKDETREESIVHVIPAGHDGHKGREDDDVSDGGRHFPVGKCVSVESGKSGRAEEVDNLVDPVEGDVVQRHSDQLYRVQWSN